MKALGIVICVGVLFVLGVSQLMLARQVDELRNERAAQRAALEEAVAEAREVEERVLTRTVMLGTNVVVNHLGVTNVSVTSVAAPLETRIAQLEQRMGISSGVAQEPVQAAGDFKVPEYNVSSPPPEEPEVAQQAVEEKADDGKRGWGEEQVLGPPDTRVAGDQQTAWASKEPDGGMEWLSVGFERPVEVAEVRIRETFNPGAVFKVTTVVGGQEVTLWEGTARGGAAPRDFVVPASARTPIQSVIIYLDSVRVRGWNEIDAVELVGRDGSRQWAVTARASSTYAAPRMAQGQEGLSR